MTPENISIKIAGEKPLATVVLANISSADSFEIALRELSNLSCPVEIIAVDDGADWNLAEAIRKNAVKSVPSIDAIDPAAEYIAILDGNETFQTPYVLEIAVRMAMLFGAQVAGGIEGVGKLSNFIFRYDPAIRSASLGGCASKRVAWLGRAIGAALPSRPVKVSRPTTAPIRETFLVIESRLARGEISELEAGRLLAGGGWHYFGEIFGPAARKNGMIRRFDQLENLAGGEHFFTFGVDPSPIARVDVPREIVDAPLLSIIMPVFNVERYLARAIESVRSQTMQSWELVCVDDGSRDRSGAIIDAYAAADPRIRVIHKPNTGVSDTRNTGLAAVRGKYVAFIDGDDWFERDMAENTMRECLRRDLDMCLFDFRPVKYDTGEELHHYWTLKNLGSHWPQGFFSAASQPRWWFYGAFWQTVWKADFLREHNAAFPPIPLGEDVCLMAELFPFVERGFVINRQFYNYQRGAPTSAVTRMHSSGDDSFVRKMKTLLEVYRRVYGNLDEPARQKFLGRMMSDFCFDSTVSENARRWMKEEGFAAFGIAKLANEAMINTDHRDHMAKLLAKPLARKSTSPADNEIPPRIAKTMREIEQERKTSAKDLYIVTAQLGSLNDEAIDGWSFFQYLKERGVPAVFVSPVQHRRYAEFKAAHPDSVIGLDDANPFKFEFLKKCRNELVRARAVVQEWPVAPDSLALWLKGLKGLAFTFMQHGVTLLNPLRKVHMHYWTENNIINFTTPQERDDVMAAIESETSGESAIVPAVCGLARYDLLRDEQDPADRILFIMFTFRPTFKNHPELYAASASLNAVKRLVCKENVARLKAAGVRPVLCLHHGLAGNREIVDALSQFTQVVPPTDVSKYIRKAACLLTDASSITMDFWQQGKPVVHWIADRYDQSLTVADHEKAYVSDSVLKAFNTAVFSANEAIAAVERHAANGFEIDAAAKAKIAAYTLPRLDGKCRERLYNAIEEYISLQFAVCSLQL